MSKQPRLPKGSPPNGSHSSDHGAASSVGYGKPPTAGFDFLAVAGPLSTLKQPRNLELVYVATHRKAGRDDIGRMHEVPRVQSAGQSFRQSTLEGSMST